MKGRLLWRIGENAREELQERRRPLVVVATSTLLKSIGLGWVRFVRSLFHEDRFIMKVMSKDDHI